MVVTYMLQYYDKFLDRLLYSILFLICNCRWLSLRDHHLWFRPSDSRRVNRVPFSMGLTVVSIIFYCGYILGCYPISLLAQRFSSGKVCGTLVLVWGICQLCTTGCFNLPAIMVQRFFPGFLEVLPGVCMI